MCMSLLPACEYVCHMASEFQKKAKKYKKKKPKTSAPFELEYRFWELHLDPLQELGHLFSPHETLSKIII